MEKYNIEHDLSGLDETLKLLFVYQSFNFFNYTAYFF